MKVLKGFLFTIILVILLIGTSIIVVPKNNSREAGTLQPTAYAVMAEKQDTIDVLTIGDSESYSSISPMEIYKEYGFTQYVCGTPSQLLCQSYDFLKNTLKNQELKVVFLETNAIYRPMTLSKCLKYKLKEIFPLIKYHNRWKTITSHDFTTKIRCDWLNDSKGFVCDTRVDSANTNKYMQTNTQTQEISRLNMYYLDKIKDICKENNIKLILLSTPSTKNWDYTKHNGVLEYADKNNLDYIDLNLKTNELSIDWSKDTRDKGDHLNYNGAKKVSSYLGEYLYNLHILDDHRNDLNYTSWNDSLKSYDSMIQK